MNKRVANEALVLGLKRKFNFSYQRRRRFSHLLLPGFFNIAKAWKLNVKEEMRLLGIKSYQDLGRRRKGKVVLNNIELEMLGWVFSIYCDLYILFPNEARHNWMKKPNGAKIFGGKSAMEYIMKGDFLMERILAVRNYLGSQTH